jgi:hypothetical protein
VVVVVDVDVVDVDVVNVDVVDVDVVDVDVVNVDVVDVVDRRRWLLWERGGSGVQIARRPRRQVGPEQL